MADPIVGIDLGTTNSVVAICDSQGEPRVLADDHATKIHPSVVSFHPNGSVIVGVDAKQRRIIDAHNTVYSAKRLIGRTFGSPEVQTSIARMPYTIKEGQNQQPVIVTRGGEFAVPEISAIVLDYVRNIAAKTSGHDVSRAVVTVPASFTDAQRSATATAGAIAGITVVRVLNEPTAAALAYGHKRQLSRVIAVYDFGGGTFDVTVLRLQDQVYEVLATAGDSFLGGDDIDEVLMEHMADEFLAKQRIDVRENEVSVMRLRAVAEQIKIELSRRTRAIVKVDEIAYGPGGAPVHLQTEISRDQLVTRAAPTIERTFAVCEEAMRLAGIDPDVIEDVVLVGGTTKIPYVRERVTQFFHRAPRTEVNPEEAVAIGAALQASALERILARRPSRRMPSDAGAAPAMPPARPVVSEHRPTAPMNAPARAATVRQTSERSVARGNAVDRFVDAAGAADSAKEIGRITSRTAAVPPPPLVRANHSSKTMLGIPVIAPESPVPDVRDVRDARDARDAATPATLDLPPTVPYDPFAPASQPTQTFPESGPLGDVGATPLAPYLSESQSIRSISSRGAADLPTQIGVPAPMFATAPSGPVVLEVTARGLGIGTVSGYCEELIRRNSRVPTEMRRMFTTSHDQQSSVRIRICQGESRRIDDNVILGDLVLDGMPPLPRGQTNIEVTFQIDVSGRLQVRARNAETGQEQRANLDLHGAQLPEEVEAARERFAELRR